MCESGTPKVPKQLLEPRLFICLQQVKRRKFLYGALLRNGKKIISPRTTYWRSKHITYYGKAEWTTSMTHETQRWDLKQVKSRTTDDCFMSTRKNTEDISTKYHVARWLLRLCRTKIEELLQVCVSDCQLKIGVSPRKSAVPSVSASITR